MITRELLLCGLLCLSCGSPPSERREQLRVPTYDAFPELGDVLAARCGTLDCHGDSKRNFRIYSSIGMRLDGVSGVGDTTAEEYTATYQSVVWLEPEVLSQVTRESGRDPERLTLVRKARGVEAHAGGSQLPAQSDGDRCLIGWLSGKDEQSACVSAAEVSRPREN